MQTPIYRTCNGTATFYETFLSERRSHRQRTITMQEKVKMPTAHTLEEAANSDNSLEGYAAINNDRDEIALLAYQYYEERGRQHGFHEDDWHRAELELRNRKKRQEQAQAPAGEPSPRQERATPDWRNRGAPGRARGNGTRPHSLTISLRRSALFGSSPPRPSAMPDCTTARLPTRPAFLSRSSRTAVSNDCALCFE